MKMNARYIPHPSPAPHGEKQWEKVYNDIQHGLVAAVAQVEDEWTRAPIEPHDSVYTGLTGLAMMQYHIAARLASPKLEYLAKRISSKLEPRGTASPLDAPRLLVEADRNLYTVVRGHPHLLNYAGDPAHSSFLETPVGVATLVLARCVGSLSDGQERDDEAERVLESLRRRWNPSVEVLSRAIERVDEEDEVNRWEAGDDVRDGGSEVLYGRAGFLYALLFLRKVVATAKEDAKVYGPGGSLNADMRKEVESLTGNASLKKVVDALVKRGRAGARRYNREMGPGRRKSPTLMWRWHGKTYLGGAHGVCGILQMMLSCPKPVIEQYLPDVLETVDWLVEIQDSEGNWPSKAVSKDTRRGYPTPDHNELVQWCHGAPAVLMLLTTVLNRDSDGYNYYKLPPELNSSIRAALRKGGNAVYERGLLAKGLGLCHGVAGSVYALLAVSSAVDTSTSTQYMKKAVHLSHLALLAGKLTEEGKMRVPDRPWSLYEGVAGMCCAWLDVLNRLAVHPEMRVGTASGMPGYDDILV